MHIKSTWSYANKGLIAILSFLVVSTIAAIIYLAYTLTNIHSLTRQNSNAVRTALVLQDLLISLQDIQTSIRGYIITGDEKFLKPQTRAQDRVEPVLKILQNDPDLLIKDADIKRIEALIEKKNTIAEHTIRLRSQEGFGAASLQISSGQGEAIMEQLRTEIATISSASLQDIGPLQQQSQADLRRALVVASAISLLILATCIAIIWYFKRAILRERALESTKNEFLSLASHQLRTPATNVKQYIGLLLDGYMGDLNEEQRKALAVAYRNNESEITIMNNLLDVAKLDLDRIQIHKKVVNVIKIAKHVVRDIKPRAIERGQTLKLEGQNQVMANVDEAYVKGVIENLIDNAIKYSNDGTVIRVVIAREQDQVIIRVKDQGLGIKKRDFNKLFNKFTRLDNDFSATSEGSGLGLYWVKKVVELHQGTIELSSHEGRGSTFTVRLPVR